MKTITRFSAKDLWERGAVAIRNKEIPNLIYMIFSFILDRDVIDSDCGYIKNDLKKYYEWTADRKTWYDFEKEE